jgi:hypothetical protein
MNFSARSTFKKLLGKGRAWLTPKGFTEDVLNLFAYPFEVVKDVLIKLKLTHFPVTYTNENNILNGEELFKITDIEGKTLTERAATVEAQWSIFGGCQNYKQIELILQRKGLPVRVIENIPQGYNLYGGRLIGNGFIQTPDGEIDPINAGNLKHCFIIQSSDFWDENIFLTTVKTVAPIKPAQNGAYFIPRYLRKKEIHHVLTKSQMQGYRKKQYCDCRTQGGH